VDIPQISGNGNAKCTEVLFGDITLNQSIQAHKILFNVVILVQPTAGADYLVALVDNSESRRTPSEPGSQCRGEDANLF